MAEDKMVNDAIDSIMKSQRQQAVGGKKPEPDLAKINHIMQLLEQQFNLVYPNQVDMALIALKTLQSMLEYCEDNKQACPSSFGINTPGGFEITYTIRKSRGANKTPTGLLIPGAP